jgi:heterodisulfide reductase subunit C
MALNAKDKIDVIISYSGAYRCVECGKCVAVCPMAEMYPGFSIHMSPRGVIKKVIMSHNILRDESIWYCTECNAGTDICPENVSCRDLIMGLRRLALARGLIKNVKTCPSCGGVYVPVPVLDYLHDKLKHMPARYLDLCPSCRRHIYLSRNT